MKSPGTAKIAAAARFWDVQNVVGGDAVYWLEVPEIAMEVNERVGGDPTRWPLVTFMDRWRERLPVRRALSMGCGVGDLERALIAGGGAVHVDGIDVSGNSLARARQLVREAGLSETIEYFEADAVTWLRRAAPGSYDLILCHGSLHHFEDLENIFALAARALRGGDPGLLYVDEFVGPSRDQWRPEHLGFAAGIFARVPVELRRTLDLSPPIPADDPTEMVRASEILPLLRQAFEVLDERPYYGNVLMPLVSGLRREALSDPRVVECIAEGIALERHLAARGLLEPFYTTLVASPR